MKAKEIRENTLPELNEQLAKLKEELFNLRFQLAINQLENPMRIAAVKKDIARVKTIIRETEIKNSANAYKLGGKAKWKETFVKPEWVRL